MLSKCNTLSLLIGVFAVQLCHGLTSEQTNEIDTLVQDVFMAQNRIPGVGVTIVEDSGSSVFAKGYGREDIERNITATENTKFCIASITKVSNICCIHGITKLYTFLLNTRRHSQQHSP